MVLSTAVKAARAAARRAASTVKTGPRGGQTRSDRLVAKSSVRRQRIVNKKLKSDQRASLVGQRRDTRGGGPNWRTGSADKAYGNNNYYLQKYDMEVSKRSMGLTKAEGLREAKKAAAIEKARRAKADGRMYFGLGAAGVAGTGFFGQQAHAAGPTHLGQKRGTNPDGTDAGIIETIKRSKTGYNVFGHDGEFMNMDADDLSTYNGLTGRRLTSKIKTKPKSKDLLSNLPAGTMLTGYTKDHLDQSRLTTPDGKDAGVLETVVRTKTGRKVFGPYGYINIK